MKVKKEVTYKFTMDQLVNLYQMYLDDESYTSIGEKYGVSRKVIANRVNKIENGDIEDFPYHKFELEWCDDDQYCTGCSGNDNGVCLKSDNEHTTDYYAPVPLEPNVNKPMKYRVSKVSIAIVKDDGDIFMAVSSDSNFNDILTHIRDDEWDNVRNIINMGERITEMSQGHIEYRDRRLFFKGIEITDMNFAHRAINMINNDNISALLHFVEKCMDNPSNRVVQRIFDFMNANDICIDEDGDIIAFKYVSDEFKDCHTNTFDNSVGTTVKMDRILVNDDDTVTCSHGLHVCSAHYLRHMRGKTYVEVKVNPKNVVSIPVDYNDSKMRCCEYEVLREISFDDIFEQNYKNFKLEN